MVENLSRAEVEERLKSVNITYLKLPVTARMKQKLRKHLEVNHPIHQYLKTLTIQELKGIIKEIKSIYNENRDRLENEISAYFFKHYPHSPLAILKKWLDGDVDESKKDTVEKKICNSLRRCQILKLRSGQKNLATRGSKNVTV